MLRRYLSTIALRKVFASQSMKSNLDWKNRWCVVAGGSSGLGYAIAMRLAEQGMKLSIIGRDREKLETSCKKFKASGSPEVAPFDFDLTSGEATPSKQSFEDFGRREDIALCVSCVGRSDRGYVSGLTTSDVKSLFDVNCIAPFHLIQLTQESVRRSNGRFVFVASLAGLVAAPGMGAYSISKSALVAMVRQLRQESPSIGVTLVCTGPIARHDSGNRYQGVADSRNLPEHLNAPGGGVNLKLLDPRQLAVQIIDAAAANKRELIVPWKVRLLLAIQAFSPSLADRLIHRSFASKDA
jgi:uncharacterized protein